MTLKEKFIEAFKSGKRFDIQNAEVIAEDFAIGFAEWLLNVSYVIQEAYTTKELLKIYKETL